MRPREHKAPGVAAQLSRVVAVLEFRKHQDLRQFDGADLNSHRCFNAGVPRGQFEQ